MIAARDADELAARAKEFTGQGIAAKIAAGDLATPAGAAAAVATATREFGALHVVINVAGGMINYGPIAGVTADMLDRELGANVKTAFFVCQAAIPALRAGGGGAIVNFASISVTKSLNGMAAYTAAKSAVAGLTRALAREVRDWNIRVNAVAPATVRTATNVAQMKPDAKTRLVELAELVRAVLFLASDDAHAVTGQVLPVTGTEF